MKDRTRRVFISYSHRDEAMKDRLVGHLRVLGRQGEIEAWHDRLIDAGRAWKTPIAEAIDRADTAILLISADFLNSAFIQEEEVTRILKLRVSRGLRVIPLIVRPCAWMAIEWLGDLQARPTDGHALSAKQPHEVETDLAALALEIFPRPRWVPVIASPPALRALGLLLLPAALMATLVVSSMAIRVATPLQLDVVARAVSFTVAGAAVVQLLNNSTAFSRLVIEQCGTVSFPPMTIGVGDISAVTFPSPVRFRCDPRVPGSRVVLRAYRADNPIAPASGSVDAQPTTGRVGPSSPELGTLGRIMAEPGDSVGFALTDSTPPAIRVEITRNASFEFAIQKDVPFEVASEFAEVDGIALPGDAHGIGAYRANLPGSSTVRLATVQPHRGLNIVLEPAHETDVEELFRADVDIPLESLSLFQRSDVDDRLVSTALSGTLRYPKHADVASVPINVGDDVRLGGLAAFRLTRLSVDRNASGLGLSFQGEAAEVSTDHEDRRVTLFDRLLFNTNLKLLAAIVAVAFQWIWLRRRWRPFIGAVITG